MAAVDLIESVDVECSPERLFGLVDDLTAYPRWLTIVPRAEGEPTVDAEPSWVVELRGRIGPLARSKRLRMVRTVCEPPTVVRFERREVDGRQHAPWTLEARVEPVERGARLTMHLHYSGSLAGSLLERMLRDEIEHSRPRLIALATTAG